MDVYVDDVMVTSWTSSGTTTAFENIDLGVSGQAVELRGVLEGSEWLSIMEVSGTLPRYFRVLRPKAADCRPSTENLPGLHAALALDNRVGIGTWQT